MTNHDQRQPRPKRTPRAGALRYASMGLELAAAICGLTLAGYWIDLKFGTGNAGRVTGAILGIVGGLYNFIRQALQMTSAAGPPTRSDSKPRPRDEATGQEDEQDEE